jgi:hypothetical protein
MEDKELIKPVNVQFMQKLSATTGSKTYWKIIKISLRLKLNLQKNPIFPNMTIYVEHPITIKYNSYEQQSNSRKITTDEAIGNGRSPSPEY